MANRLNPNRRENIEAYLELKTTPDPNSGCLLWTAGADKDGYGKLNYHGKARRAHTVAFEIFHGAIPHGHLIQHTCDTPACCNIQHLRLGTPLSNMQDKVRKGRLRNQNMNKTHCKRGHEFTQENLYTYNGIRSCRICTLAHHKKTRDKKRAQLAIKAIDITSTDKTA